MTSQLIFVSGPYSAETDAEKTKNTVRACEAGLEIIQKGHWPYLPHLSHFFSRWHTKTYGFDLDYEAYMDWCFAILRRCDGLVFLASSPGADRERALAEELGLPVFETLGDVPRAGR